MECDAGRKQSGFRIGDLSTENVCLCYAPTIFHAAAVNGLNSFASIWCVAENIFLAATAEGLACSMRIPVGEEGGEVTAALGVPEGYMMPCYIGIGYPAENTPVIEQVNRNVKSTLHFGK